MANPPDTLATRLARLEAEHLRLRQDYDSHLVFGKWGSMAAIAIFLVLFSVLICDRLINL